MTKVKEMMTTEVECCTPLDNMYEAAVKMRDYNVGAIPIVDGNRLVGIVTDRDLVIRGIAEKKPGSTAVTEVMSKQLVTISPDASVAEAARLMAKHQIRRLPVVEGDTLVGMVSLGDLATHTASDEQAGEALTEISQYH
ncbi:CBS domain-containing protein [Bhargavaea massiliensis]